MTKSGIWFGTVTIDGEQVSTMIKADSVKMAFAFVKPFSPWDGPKHFRDYWSHVDSHSDADNLPNGIYFAPLHTRLWSTNAPNSKKKRKAVKALILLVALFACTASAMPVTGIVDAHHANILTKENRWAYNKDFKKRSWEAVVSAIDVAMADRKMVTSIDIPNEFEHEFVKMLKSYHYDVEAHDIMFEFGMTMLDISWKDAE